MSKKSPRMKVVTVVGARPQFIKSAPVSIALKAQGIEEVMVHTGQHYDANMSEVFFAQMNLTKPAYVLSSGGSSHAKMTADIMVNLESILQRERPDALVVYGDTNSTLAGALCAAKLNIPVAHIEAGLRSNNWAMPEEINRIVVDKISTQLFTPTTEATQLLKSESIEQTGAQVIQCGDTMFDAVKLFGPKAAWSPALGDASFFEAPFALVTLHRAENVDDVDRLRSMVNGLNALNSQHPVCWPIHPRTAAQLKKHDLKFEGHTLDPIGYLEMNYALKHAAVVITDSGGLQKEAYFHGKRCITLRTETEWVELLKHENNTLLHPLKAEEELAALAAGLWEKPVVKIDAYGNGDAASIIAKTLLEITPV